MRLGRGVVLAAALAVALGACGEEPSDQDAGVSGRDGGTDAGFVVVCDPPCAEDEVCDGRQTPPSCMPACNAPVGCKPDIEVCNPETKKCEPVSCNGATCETGQRCVNLATGTTDAPVACTCLPRRPDPSNRGAMLEDTCASLGMVCERTLGEEVPQAGKCVKPGARERCVSSVGCRDGLECAAFGNASFCTRPCTTAADCSDPRDTCRADLGNKCWVNPCAVNDRSQYFQKCRAEAGDDGTCVPQSTGNTDSGVCTLFGTAAPGAECDPQATRSEPAKRCSFAHACVPVQADAASSTKLRGVCLPMCNAAPGATAMPLLRCATGEACETFLGDPNEQEARLGVCRTKCDLLGSPSCPAGPLGNAQGCHPLDGRDAATGVCRPQRTGAGSAEGDPCAAPANRDERERCGSALTCAQAPLATAGKCYAYCDVTRCSDAQASCAGCSAAAPRCSRLAEEPGVTVGMCQP